MDSPRDLARWFLCTHGLTPPVSYAELVDACRQDGVRVIVSKRRPRGRGYCVGGPAPFILLREAGDARVLSHEIAHSISEEATGDFIAAYAGAEEFAEAFAAVLCDPPEG